MKQINMFSQEKKEQSEYTGKVEAPIYEPKNQKPDVFELCDKFKTAGLIQEIDQSNLPDDEKRFLTLAAYRHCIFNYEKIADYYAHASKEFQHLADKSALVIVDFDKAIENGYVQLFESIKKQYMEEYPDEDA